MLHRVKHKHNAPLKVPCEDLFKIKISLKKLNIWAVK